MQHPMSKLSFIQHLYASVQLLSIQSDINVEKSTYSLEVGTEEGELERELSSDPWTSQRLQGVTVLRERWVQMVSHSW